MYRYLYVYIYIYLFIINVRITFTFEDKTIGITFQQTCHALVVSSSFNHCSDRRDGLEISDMSAVGWR